MGSCPPLRCQMSRLAPKRQVRLITHARNPKDLTRLIFSSENLASSGCRFHLALWENGTLSLLVLNLTHIGLDEMILDWFQVYPRRPKGLELERDTWNGTPPQCPHNPSISSGCLGALEHVSLGVAMMDRIHQG